jgi:phosphoribosyl-ATP pyrophosphohydrolase/phosphoribosyl-AMP cyclohydrolase
VTRVAAGELRFDERGLIPAVVQEAATGELLMVAWMNREALEATLATGLSHFWSRSRGALWQKGETSGHRQHVHDIHVDCDADTLLVQVHQEGVACHTGNRTCFFRALERGPGADSQLGRSPGSDSPLERSADGKAAVDRSPAGEALAPANMLERLERIVAARKAAPPPGSYVGALLARGEAAVCRKIGEEAVEVVTAALGGEGDERVVAELADLWFHTVVLLGARGLTVRAVLEELARRHAAAPRSG